MSAIVEPVSPLAPPPRQRSKPCLPLRGVVALVDKSKEEVLELIEDGSILWCWDVALSQRDGRKRELRILPAAVADYLKGRPCDLDQATVSGLLLPDGPTIPANTIAHILNVSVEHVYNLLDGGQLVASAARRKGPGGSSPILTTSFIRFLQKRKCL